MSTPTSRDRLLDHEGRATFLSHFLGAHCAFRRDAARFPLALRALGAGQGHGPPPDVDALRGHWNDYATALAYHHRMEDELLFPAIRAAAPAAGVVIEDLTVQHHRLDAAIAEVHAMVGQLPAPDAVVRAAGAFDELAAALDVHLDAEEDHLLPLMTATMFEPGAGGGDTASDAEEGSAADGGHRFLLPWMADGLDDEVVTALLDGLPPPVRAELSRWRADYVDRLGKWWR